MTGTAPVPAPPAPPTPPVAPGPRWLRLWIGAGLASVFMVALSATSGSDQNPGAVAGVAAALGGAAAAIGLVGLRSGKAWPFPFTWPVMARVATALLVLCSLWTGLAGVIALAGALVFATEARRLGALGRWDPRLLWFGWRRGILLGTVLAAGTLGYAAWSTYYSNLYYSFAYVEEFTAMELGYHWLPGSLLALGLLASGWLPAVGRRHLARVVPLGVAVACSIQMIVVIVRTQPPEGATAGSSAAAAPFLFLLVLVPYVVSAVALLLGRDGKRGRPGDLVAVPAPPAPAPATPPAPPAVPPRPDL